MVWVNYEHHNYEVPEGIFGGAICMCKDCIEERKRKEKTAIEIIQEAQLPNKINNT